MNKQGTDMSIAELMEGMKDSADEIIGKGENLVKRYNTPFDNFEAIRRRAQKMVNNGEMSNAEAVTWIAERDAEEYAETAARVEALNKDTKPVEPPPYYEGADPVEIDCISIHDNDYKVRTRS